MDYYTQTGERPDLNSVAPAAIELAIGSKLMPTVPVREKTGAVYYLAAATMADVSAATGRSVGVAPTATQLASSASSYTAAEVIKRSAVSPDEAKQFGDIAKADEVGAKCAKRSVLLAREGAICTATLGIAKTASFDPDTLGKDIQAAKNALKLFPGRFALFASETVIQSMVTECLKSQVLGPVFCRLISGTSNSAAAEGMKLEAWVNGLGMYLGAQILVGSDDIWNATAVAGKFGVTKLDESGDPLSHKYLPIFGKTYQFLPDGSQEFEMQSVGDRITLNNFYDAKCWYNSVVLNATGVRTFDGVPA